MAIIDLSEVIPKFAPGGGAYSRPVRYASRLKAEEREIKRGRTVNRDVEGRPQWRGREQMSNSAQALVDRVRRFGWDAEVEEAMQNYKIVDETGVSVRDQILESMSKDEVSMLNKARKEYLKNRQAPTAENGVPTGRERELQDAVDASNKQIDELRAQSEASKATNAELNTQLEAEKATSARRISEYEEKLKNLEDELAKKVEEGTISQEKAEKYLVKLDATKQELAELQDKYNKLTASDKTLVAVQDKGKGNTEDTTGDEATTGTTKGRNTEDTTGTIKRRNTEDTTENNTNKEKWYKRAWYKNPLLIGGVAGIGGYLLHSDDDEENVVTQSDNDEQYKALESKLQEVMGKVTELQDQNDKLVSAIANGVPRDIPVGNDRTNIDAELKIRDQKIEDLTKALLTQTARLEDLISKQKQTPEPVVISPTDETLDALRREYYEQSMKHRPLKRRRLRKTINTILSEHGLHDDWID